MSRIISINDINTPELAVYARLTEAQLKKNQDIFIAESVKVIENALDAGIKPVSFLMEQRQIDGIGKPLLMRCPNIPVYTAPREVLCSLTGFELTRGVLCAMERPEPIRLDTALTGATRVAVIEGLSDGANVGSVFRNAAALGFDAVLLYHNCSEPLNRRTVRVSMGSVFKIPWAYFDKPTFPLPQNAVEYLKAKGFLTAALALKNDSINIDDEVLSSSQKLALFLGSEGSGLDTQTINACDKTVMIPMQHGVDSLNVAAAAAISFWQLKRK